MAPDGLKAKEKIVAGSIPRRSSTSRAQLLVAKTRIKVPWKIIYQRSRRGQVVMKTGGD